MSRGGSERLGLAARSEAARTPRGLGPAHPLVGGVRTGSPGGRSLGGSAVGFPSRTEHRRAFPAALRPERWPETAGHPLPPTSLSSWGCGTACPVGGTHPVPEATVGTAVGLAVHGPGSVAPAQAAARASGGHCGGRSSRRTRPAPAQPRAGSGKARTPSLQLAAPACCAGACGPGWGAGPAGPPAPPPLPPPPHTGPAVRTQARPVQWAVAAAGQLRPLGGRLPMHPHLRHVLRLPVVSTACSRGPGGTALWGRVRLGVPGLIPVLQRPGTGRGRCVLLRLTRAPPLSSWRGSSGLTHCGCREVTSLPPVTGTAGESTQVAGPHGKSWLGSGRARAS